MNDSVLMCFVHGRAGLFDDVHHPFDWKLRLFSEDVGERAAVKIFHHQIRNSIIAHTADALIAVDGEYGTLSEVALGLKLGKPVVGLRPAWKIAGMAEAKTPAEAVEMVWARVKKT